MQDTSSKQQTKQKYKPNHQQTGGLPDSALPIRGKTSVKLRKLKLYQASSQNHNAMRLEINYKKKHKPTEIKQQV